MTPSNLHFGTTINHFNPTTPKLITGQTSFEISAKNHMNKRFTKPVIPPTYRYFLITKKPVIFDLNHNLEG